MGHFYFICPTDYLEPVINSVFKQENYFFASLGNSIELDSKRLTQFHEFIEKKSITRITFVLSQNNKFVLDALENKDFSGITGLNTFYDQIDHQKLYSEMLWQNFDRHFMVLSHHINLKMKELGQGLSYLSSTVPSIRGMIYDHENQVFKEVYSDLICNDYVGVN